MKRLNSIENQRLHKKVTDNKVATLVFKGQRPDYYHQFKRGGYQYRYEYYYGEKGEIVSILFRKKIGSKSWAVWTMMCSHGND